MSDASQDRAIGRIEGKLDLIIADQEKARVDRRAQYERLERIERNAEATDRKIERVDERLGNVEEPVAEFSRWRERGVGAIMLISFIAASLGGLIAAMWGKIVAFFSG